MKILSLLLISFLMPIFANAEVHCSMVAESSCPPSEECINVDAILGQTTPTVDAEAEAVD